MAAACGAPAVGARVLVAPDDSVATVRYVGVVAGTEGEWVGVEYDCAGRGKHDGVHGGVRYFQCAAAGGPQAASFVRPHKLRAGVTLLQALTAKYEQGNASKDAGRAKAASDAPADGSKPDEDLYVRSGRGRRIIVELCMKEELMAGQRCLDRLTRAYLPDAGVSSVGPPGEVAQRAGGITVLDLQGALLPDWPAVARLNEELPNLQVLNLSRVRSVLPREPAVGLPFARLRTLVLNASDATWPQVCRLQQVLPALEELHMCDCGLTRLETEAIWPRLRVLNLDGNALSEWADVALLAHQPILEQLHLSGNQLTCVQPPPDAGAFRTLRTLLLAGNRIADWLSVDALDAFPALIETRLTGNPVVETNPHTRHEVVARVQRLGMLNGSLVGHAERRDAEIRYLRRALDEASTATAADATAAVAERHPRMAQLLEKIGELAPGGGAGAAPVGGACLADDMLSLTLCCVAASAGERLPCAKRVPRTMTLARLKQLCDRLFRVPAARMALFVRRPGAPMPEALTEEPRDLYWLGVGDGDTILVDDIAK